MNPLTEADIDQALMQQRPSPLQRIQPHVRNAVDNYVMPVAGVGLGMGAGAIGALGNIKQIPRMAMTIK